MQPCPGWRMGKAKAEERQNHLRDHDPGEGDQCDINKEQQVEEIVEPGGSVGAAEKLPTHGDDPLPVDEQVGDDRCAKGNTEPFVNSNAGKTRGGGDEKSNEDEQVNEQIGTSSNWLAFW